MTATSITINAGARKVSGLLIVPPRSSICYVFAHGAGAGMAHKSMAAIAEGLSDRGIATLRFNFPYMESGSKHPDAPAVAHAAVRAAVTFASGQLPSHKLFAGGKSFGGRMTSQAQAAVPLTGVRGLIFFGFPLHPAGKPSADRAQHLADVQVPMLFLQGTRDALADLELLRPVTKKLGARATLSLIEDADHSFHVPAKLERKDAQVMAEVLDTARDWMSAH